MLTVPVTASVVFELESWMDCKWLVVCKALQPSILNTSIAQANAAKRVVRFTAEYLQKEIFRIVAASVIQGKVTKVTKPHGREPLSGRVPIGRSQIAAARCWRSEVVYNHPMSDQMSDQPVPPPPQPPPPPNPITEFHIGDEFGTA